MERSFVVLGYVIREVKSSVGLCSGPEGPIMPKGEANSFSHKAQSSFQ